MSYMMSIGKNLKKIRTKRNLTQGQLADDAGISLNQISRIERGTAKPELETIKKLVKTLKCSSDELIFDDNDYFISDELRILFSAVEELSDDKKEMIQDFIEAMIMKSDVERWVNKTTKEATAKAIIKDISSRGLAEAVCKDCGAEMVDEKPTGEQINNGIFSIRRCPKCGRTHVMTGDLP